MSSLPNFEALLSENFGFAAFRPGQREIVDAVYHGWDTLALMPTGGGKSICYQLPTLALGGLCLVVSPLIALMKDQVRLLRKRGHQALALHSGLPFADVKKILDMSLNGHITFLFVSPERIQTTLFQEYLPGLPLSLVAVDEAHCISQWGYDFRPPYLKIAELRTEHPKVPILALTASATPQVQQDIVNKLAFRPGYKVYAQSFAKPNLSFLVRQEVDKLNKLKEILQPKLGSSLVYCRNRKSTREIANWLQQSGINASYYHAGLSTEDRSQRQDDWMQDRVPVMVCTNAFGMGIDKPNVRTVVHIGLPDSLEAYYQEAGRAGRDGKRSYAVLVHNPSDLNQLLQLPIQKFLPLETISSIYQKIGNYLGIAEGDGQGNYYAFNLQQFCESFKLESHTVLNALQALQTAGYISFNESAFLPPTVQVIGNRSMFNELEKQYPELDDLVKLLLRNYEGITEDARHFQTKWLARQLSISEPLLLQRLETLHNRKVVHFVPQLDTAQIYYLYHRVPVGQLLIDTAVYRQHKKNYEQRIKAMHDYVVNRFVCRSRFIRDYFGDAAEEVCGICDVCVENKNKQISEATLLAARQHILEALTKPMTTTQLRLAATAFEPSCINKALEELLAEEKIIQQRDGVLNKGEKPSN